jgi:hypothetical protein
MGSDLIFEMDVRDPIKFILFLQAHGLECNLIERGTIDFINDRELPISLKDCSGLFKEYAIICIKKNGKIVGEFKFEYVNVLPGSVKLDRPMFFEKAYGEYIKACLWGDFWAIPVSKFVVKVINDECKNLIASYKDEYTPT